MPSNFPVRRVARILGTERQQVLSWPDQISLSWPRKAVRSSFCNWATNIYLCKLCSFHLGALSQGKQVSASLEGKNKRTSLAADPILDSPTPHSNYAVNRVTKREIPQLLGTAAAHRSVPLDLDYSGLSVELLVSLRCHCPELQGKFPRTINGQVSTAERCWSGVSIAVAASVCLSSQKQKQKLSRFRQTTKHRKVYVWPGKRSRFFFRTILGHSPTLLGN